MQVFEVCLNWAAGVLQDNLSLEVSYSSFHMTDFLSRTDMEPERKKRGTSRLKVHFSLLFFPRC